MSRYRRDLFPVSIYHGSVDDNARLKKLLIDRINNTKTLEDAVPPDGWSTDNLQTSFGSDRINKFVFGENGNNEEGIKNDLVEQYLKTIDSFIDKSWEIHISEIWYNVYENGEWQEMHRHISSQGSYGDTSHFACVHFLAFDPNVHQPLGFNDPLSLNRALGFEFESARNPEKLQVRVQEGDLLMFPAWLEHEVLPGEPTPGNPRITVAFNFTITNYGEEEEGDD